MDKIRQALIDACNEMDKKAREMNMKGVAVASLLAPKETVNWIGEMKVVDTPYNAEGGDRGWNLVAIAWSKAGEVIATGANSGNPERNCMCGELNFVGGAYGEAKGYKFAFAFSGGTSEDDLVVAQYGIEKISEML